MRELSTLLRQDGVAIASRLSVAPAHPGPRSRRPARSAASRRLARLYAASKGQNATGLHLSALLDLAYSQPEDVVAVNRAIKALHAARGLAPAASPVLADLAAAYLERADRTQSLADLPRAVQAASDALELDAHNLAARYNLALALDRMTLDDQARRAWDVVAETADDPETVREAKSRAAALRTSPRMPQPAHSEPAAVWTAYAAREPQHARLHAMETLLARWGHAISAGDSMAAGRWLGLARAVGDALQQAGGDASLADQVRAIRAAAAQPRIHRDLARAHAQYGRAQGFIDLRVPRAALPALDSALALSAASPALREWVAYWRGVALFYDGRPDTLAFRRAIARGEALGYPALAARGHWSSAIMPMRTGAYDSAQARLDRARSLYERLDEREHLGSIQELEAEMRLDMGDAARAHAAARRALLTLRPYRDSVRLHNLLMALAGYAGLEGLGAAAAALHDEDVAVAARVRAGPHVEALTARARSSATAGDLASAEADLRRADAQLRGEVARWMEERGASADSTYEHVWLAAHLSEGFARLRIHENPTAAAGDLARVVEFFGSRSPAVNRLLPALVLRAEARLMSGDENGALDDLDRSSRLLDSLSGRLADASVRAAMLNAGRRVFDQLALLRAGDPRAALTALERGRVSFGSARRTPRDPRRRMGAPAGTVVVDYALVGDTLLTFTLSDITVRLERRRVNAAHLLRAAEHARVSMELRAPTDSVITDLALLYDALVRPVQARLTPGMPLVIVADGEMGGIPFEALWDTARKRYLLQDHEIRSASSLADAHSAAPDHGSAPGRALFVADPAFRPVDYPGLQRLGGLAQETREVASRYPDAVTLSDLAATSSALVSRLRSSDFFYFAGHAVFDDGRPERSFLLLAPDGPSDDGRMTAEELAAMDLRGVRLVVLSACETQRSVSGRAGGFAGLSGAVLAAGAGGVVGSLWRVDDAYTRALMAEFHGAYRASGDAAAALRHAQLRLLDSSEPSLRSPSAWAGFRYAGADLS
ncbi:MAG TPA: CHAT domain-containing protein [Longimicrobium sp.]